MNLKKWCLVLTVLAFVSIALTACGPTPTETLCPEWATPVYGERCDTTSLSVSSTDDVTLFTYGFGYITPNHAKIRAYNVVFYDTKGNIINPKDLKNGQMYKLIKMGSEGKIFIIMEFIPNKPSTHILLARP